MATLDWTSETIDGVTLVELVVTSSTEQRVRIESNLTPVWPPRRQGRPAAGWDGGTFEQRVDANGRLTVGYASPAEAVEPPAELSAEPPADDDTVDPQDVIRALGDGTPPRDAVPAGPSSAAEKPATAEGSTVPDAEQEPRRRGQNCERAAALPPAVEAYFEALDQRLTAGKRLADPGTVEQAQAAVTAAGGMEAVERLDRQLRADRQRLEHLERRQQALAGRLDAIEIPVERLDRLT